MGLASVDKALLPIVTLSAWVGVVWWGVLKLDHPIPTLSVAFTLLYEGSNLITLWCRGETPRATQIAGGLIALAGLALMSR